MKTSSIKPLLLIAILILVSVKPLSAQVAAPQQFSSRQSENPATVVLFEDSSIAYIQNSGSGESNTVINYFGFEYDSGESEEYTSERKSALGVYASEDWGLEAFMDVSHKNVIENKNSSGSSVATAGNDYTIENKLQYVLWGTRFGPALNWGIRVAQQEETVKAFQITSSDLALGLGITYQLIDNLFFGVGGNLINSESTAKVANMRYDYYYGVSYGFKPNTETGVRFEANSTNSPEDGEPASGNKVANNHRATAETLLVAELRYLQIKASYQKRSVTISPLSTRPSEGKDTTDTAVIGIGYVLDKPAAFIEASQYTTERKRGQYTTTDSKALELSVGILF